MNLKLILVSIFILGTVTVWSQKIYTTTNDFVLECTKNTEIGNRKQMSIWFAGPYWDYVKEQMKSTPYPELVESLIDKVKDYMVFIAVDYTISTAGFSFLSENELRKNMQLIDSSGSAQKPLEEKDLPADVKRLLQNLKPAMSQMLGQFGEGASFFVFKIPKINGEPTINVKKKNRFSLTWNKALLAWKLPLSSVVPPKLCPIDNEKMNANWEFCPYHGNKLD